MTSTTRRRLFAPALLIALCLALAGCLSLPRENLEIVRYSFRPDSLGSAMGETYDRALVILPFEASATQQGDRINFREKNNRSGSYYYHRWIAAPHEMLSDVIAEDVTKSNLFGRGVFQLTMGSAPSYELHGRLVHLYADNAGPGESAVLELVLSLFRMKPPFYEKFLVLQRTYHYEVPRRNDHVNSFIPASTQAVDRLLGDVRSMLAEELRNPAPLPQDTSATAGMMEDARDGLQRLERQVRQLDPTTPEAGEPTTPPVPSDTTGF